MLIRKTISPAGKINTLLHLNSYIITIFITRQVMPVVALIPLFNYSVLQHSTSK
jgi:hypothetical protein